MYIRKYKICYYEPKSPFMIVESEGDALPFYRSILIKSVYEFLYESDDISGLISQLNPNDYIDYIENSFKCKIHSHGAKSVDRVEVITEVIKNMGITGKIDLKDAQQTFGICLYNDEDKVLRKVFFGRLITAKTEHHASNLFNLKERRYIGTTSMDSTLSLLMANCGLVTAGSVVYDPFVGTGSLITVASYFGGLSIGSDLDGRQIRGTMKGAKKGTKGVYGNFESYNLLNKYIGSIIFDFSKHPFRDIEFLDSILSDPPYCIRASAKKIASSPDIDLGKIVLPSVFEHTEMYQLHMIIYDLLEFAARHLRIGGRLVYWLPLLHENGCTAKIPLHPSLDLIHSPGQVFSKWTRFMVVMEKTSGYKKMLDSIEELSKFREGYFSKTA